MSLPVAFPAFSQKGNRHFEFFCKQRASERAPCFGAGSFAHKARSTGACRCRCRIPGRSKASRKRLVGTTPHSTHTHPAVPAFLSPAPAKPKTTIGGQKAQHRCARAFFICAKKQMAGCLAGHRKKNNLPVPVDRKAV